jgi:hypothetical protein
MAQKNMAYSIYEGRLVLEFSVELENFVDLFDDLRPIAEVDQPIPWLQTN